MLHCLIIRGPFKGYYAELRESRWRDKHDKYLLNVSCINKDVVFPSKYWFVERDIPPVVHRLQNEVVDQERFIPRKAPPSLRDFEPEISAHESGVITEGRYLVIK